MKRRIFKLLVGVCCICSVHVCFSQELRPVESSDGKYGFINEHSQWIIMAKYEGAGNFSEGLAYVQLNGNWGYIDKTGKLVIPCRYQKRWHVDNFSEGLAKVQLNDKCGFIDKAGNTVIPFRYEEAGEFSEGLAMVKLNNKCGYIDKTGNTVIPFRYEEAGPFREGLSAVKLNDKYGFIDRAGNVVIPFQYENVWFRPAGFREGLIAVQLNGKYGYIDKTGKLVIPYLYDNAWFFSEGLAKVDLNGNWGYIDKTGKLVIPYLYDGAGEFSEGLARVELNGKYGFIDKAGKTVIPFRYESAYDFSNGFAYVKLNGKYVCIDINGNEVSGTLAQIKATVTERNKLGKYNNVLNQIADANKRLDNSNPSSNIQPQTSIAGKTYDSNQPFSVYAQNYVQDKINAWQKRGEFEKTVDWQKRVTEATRKAKAEQLLKEAEQAFIASKTGSLSLGSMTLGEYDPDHEVFLINNDLYGNWLVHVPIAEAQAFKLNWNSMKKTPKYFIENDGLSIAEMTFSASGKSYAYNNKASLNYTTAKIDYNFAPIEVDVVGGGGIAATPKGNQNISTVNVSVGKADVDVNIPANAATNSKTFAVIISNETYQQESQVEFALNDGRVFKEYCLKTLGLPEKNVHYNANATLNNIRYEINWINGVANAFNGEASIIFYYAGHGIPDETDKTAYLLPVDGYGSDVTTGYKLDDLYTGLGNLPARSVTVFLDACFSGAQRNGDMLASARGVKRKAVQGKPVGNMVVFSASQGDETAYPHREKGHGLFTYFLLKKLQETKGEVTLGELSSYVTTEVSQQSIVVNKKSQTPTVIPSAALADKWKNMKLK